MKRDSVRPGFRLACRRASAGDWVEMQDGSEAEREADVKRAAMLAPGGVRHVGAWARLALLGAALIGL
ncbi:MAG: hypothetical protein AAFR47_11310, partial [Pseudomonadota bacterium]